MRPGMRFFVYAGEGHPAIFCGHGNGHHQWNIPSNSIKIHKVPLRSHQSIELLDIPLIDMGYNRYPAH